MILQPMAIDLSGNFQQPGQIEPRGNNCRHSVASPLLRRLLFAPDLLVDKKDVY